MLNRTGMSQFNFDRSQIVQRVTGTNIRCSKFDRRPTSALHSRFLIKHEQQRTIEVERITTYKRKARRESEPTASRMPLMKALEQCRASSIVLNEHIPGSIINLLSKHQEKPKTHKKPNIHKIQVNQDSMLFMQPQAEKISPFNKKHDAQSLHTIVRVTPEINSIRSTPSPSITMMGSKASFYESEKKHPALDVKVVSVS